MRQKSPLLLFFYSYAATIILANAITILTNDILVLSNEFLNLYEILLNWFKANIWIAFYLNNKAIQKPHYSNLNLPETSPKSPLNSSTFSLSAFVFGIISTRSENFGSAPKRSTPAFINAPISSSKF